MAGAKGQFEFDVVLSREIVHHSTAAKRIMCYPTSTLVLVIT
jgi:hypothetical protein